MQENIITLQELNRIVQDLPDPNKFENEILRYHFITPDFTERVGFVNEGTDDERMITFREIIFFKQLLRRDANKKFVWRLDPKFTIITSSI